MGPTKSFTFSRVFPKGCHETLQSLGLVGKVLDGDTPLKTNMLNPKVIEVWLFGWKMIFLFILGCFSGSSR